MTYLLIFLALVLILIVMTIIILWPLARELSHGKQRPSCHEPLAFDILARPEHYALTIDTLPCLNGSSECLLITPQAGLAVSSSAHFMRERLPDYGITPAPYGEIQAIMVLLHGKDGQKEQFVLTALRYAAAGFAVILPDLPNHGKNTRPYTYFGSTEEEAAIAPKMLALAREKLGANLPGVLWALSLGASYGNHSLSRYPDTFSAAVIMSTFSRLDRILARQLGPLPGSFKRAILRIFRLLLRARGGADSNKVVPIQWAAHITTPIFQIHAKKDPLISIALGRELFAAYASTDKTFVPVDSASHHNPLLRALTLYPQTAAWLLEHIAKKVES